MPIYEFECNDCGGVSSILFRSYSSSFEEKPQCEQCGSTALRRLISKPGLIRASGGGGDGQLRAVNPRKAVENMSRQYDKAGIDPGRGFEEVARRAAAGDSPETLKEIVKEAKQKEAKQQAKAPSSSSNKGEAT